MNINNMDKGKLNKLLDMASKKMGADKSTIENAVNSDKANELLSKLPAGDKAKILSILNNPEMANKMLATPQAKELFKKLTGEDV